MWAGIVAIAGILYEALKFTFAAITNRWEQDKEKRKTRDEIYEKEIKPAKNQRDRINAINRFNAI